MVPCRANYEYDRIPRPHTAYGVAIRYDPGKSNEDRVKTHRRGVTARRVRALSLCSSARTSEKAVAHAGSRI